MSPSAQYTTVPDQKSFQKTAIEPVADIIHNRLRAQASSFRGREHRDIKELCYVQLTSVIDEIDGNLWECVWTMLYGSKTEHTTEPVPAHEHMKKMRCLYIISCMLHVAVPSCTFPLHTALADIVDVYSHSSQLMSILAKVGAVAGVDTHKRYCQTVIDQRAAGGMNSDIPANMFSVASVDNIDKNQPGKRMYCNDISRGF